MVSAILGKHASITMIQKFNFHGPRRNYTHWVVLNDNCLSFSSQDPSPHITWRH